MSTRRKAARRVVEDISNAGVPPQDNQDPPQAQAPINPLVISDGQIRVTFVI